MKISRGQKLGTYMHLVTTGNPKLKQVTGHISQSINWNENLRNIHTKRTNFTVRTKRKTSINTEQIL